MSQALSVKIWQKVFFFGEACLGGVSGGDIPCHMQHKEEKPVADDVKNQGA